MSFFRNLIREMQKDNAKKYEDFSKDKVRLVYGKSDNLRKRI